jgi:hypothetical protein
MTILTNIVDNHRLFLNFGTLKDYTTHYIFRDKNGYCLINEKTKEERQQMSVEKKLKN